MTSQNSFGAAGKLKAGGREYEIFRLAALEKAGIAQLSRIPYSIKILLENLLRFEDGTTVKKSDIEYVAKWDPKAPATEINSGRRAFCFRISPACPAWSTSPPCAMPSPRWAPIRRKPIL